MHYAIQDFVHKTLGWFSPVAMHYEVLCTMTLCIVRISSVESKTWDETFTEYDFSKCQQEVIKYFNVLYECLDAHDDYSAMRKNTEHQRIFPQWTTNEMLDDLDEDELNSEANLEDDNHILDSEYDRIGDQGRWLVEQMMETANIVKNSGWMNESIDGVPEHDTNAIQPERMQGVAKWDGQTTRNS
jgi:hypothetical protein